MNTLRRLPLKDSPMHVREFVASFVVSSGAYLELSYQGIASDGGEEVLPYYRQNSAITVASLLDIDTFRFTPRPGVSSFTSVSRRMGLSDSMLEIVRENGETLLKVHGKDMACDLLAGLARLEARVPSHVQITQEESSRLENFYNGSIGSEINKVFKNKTESDVLKAARLGYRLGRLLEDELRSSEEVTEKHLSSMFNVLFVPKTLKPSPHMVEIGNKQIIKVKSMVDGKPITLRFGL
jgi:hypothetical protein